MSAFIFFGLVTTSCQNRDFNHSPDSSQVDSFGKAPALTPEQRKDVSVCKSRGGKRELCTAYGVSGGNKKIQTGTMTMLIPEYFSGLKNGSGCELQFNLNSSSVFGIPYGSDLYAMQKIGTEAPAYIYFSEPLREFTAKEKSGEDSRTYVFSKYWIKFDENYKLTSFGYVVGSKGYKDYPAGSPIYECKLTGTRDSIF
jgi:hypothetical protein